MIDLVVIGKRVTMLRKKAHMTQDALAKRLYTSRQNLSKWERGEAPLPLEQVERLAVVFSVSSDYLLGIDEIRPVICKRGVDIFRGYEDKRYLIIEKIRENAYEGPLHEVFDQFTPQERMQLLSSIRTGDTYANKEALREVLFSHEKVYLGEIYYEIAESHH